LAATTVSGPGGRIPVSYARKGHRKQPILVLFNEDSSLEHLNEISMNNLAPKNHRRESTELDEKEISSNS